MRGVLPDATLVHHLVPVFTPRHSANFISKLQGSSLRSQKPPSPDTSKVSPQIRARLHDFLQVASGRYESAIHQHRKVFRSLPYQPNMTQDVFISRLRAASEELQQTQSKCIEDGTESAIEYICQLPEEQQEFAGQYWKQSLARTLWYWKQTTERAFQGETEMIELFRKLWEAVSRTEDDIEGLCKKRTQWLESMAT
jgi:hypothetical protein